MPELPEVETIVRQLNAALKGKKIKSAKVSLSRLVKCPVKKFRKAVEGAVVKRIGRRAKMIIVGLSNGCSLVIHLKMTGQLIAGGTPGKHTHIIYEFAGGGRLIHNDLRRFGFVKVMPTAELDNFFAQEKFGPEPLEKSFTPRLFAGMLAGKKGKKIKPLLMDQKFISGVGNIYGDEILFFAGVLPERKAGSLSSEEIKKIYAGIKKILSLAVKKRGSSTDDYLDARGKKGDFVKFLKVYGREGEPCKKCGAEIRRLKIGGRSAHFCPRCQK